MDEYKTYRKIQDRIDKEENALLKTYPNEVKEFLQAAGSYHITTIVKVDHAQAIRKYLLETGNKPSTYFKEHKDYYKGWIRDELLDSFYYAVDNVIYYQHTDSSYRRTLRSGAYEDNIGKIAAIISAFHKDSIWGKDAMGLLCGKLTEEEEIYFTFRRDRIHGYLIAAELDRGNKELEDYLEDQIFGEGTSVNYEMIRGIMMSKSTRLYEALGKLLLAAKLQEGLRQSICENMDCGREEAFLYFYKILIDNDMFRFSSVIRAGATWTGIINTDSSKLDRISKKMFELCYEYLTNLDARKAALSSEDSMELYMALWAFGCHDSRDSSQIAKDIFANGTPHQRLVAMYYLLEMGFGDCTITEALKFHADETDLMALAIPHLRVQAYHCIDKLTGSVYGFNNNKERDKLKKIKDKVIKKAEFVIDEADARLVYDRLVFIYKNIKGKKAEFDPVVFPWYSATLSKSDLVMIMAYIARYVKDKEIEETVLSHIADLEGNYKAYVLLLLASVPETPFQRKTVLSMISSGDTETRCIAFDILGEMDLTSEDYSALEDSLRLKKADMRKEILSILYNLKGQELLDTIERLLAAKSEEKRLGGLSLIMMLKNDEERSSEFKESLKLLETDAERTDHENTLIAEIKGTSISEGSKVTEEPLYDPDATYKPVLDEAWISKCRETFAKVFPDSVLAKNEGDAGKGLKAGKKILDKVLGKGSSSDEKEKLFALAHELDDLIVKNKDKEYVDREGENRLLRDAQHLYGSYVDNKPEIIFHDLWDEFYKKTLGSDYTLVLRLLMLVYAPDSPPGYEEFFEDAIKDIFGPCYEDNIEFNYPNLVRCVLQYLETEYRDSIAFIEIGASVYSYLLNEYKGPLAFNYTYKNRWSQKEEKAYKTIISHPIMARFGEIYIANEDFFDKLFPIKCAVADKADLKGEKVEYGYRYESRNVSIQDYLKACQLGIISRQFLDTVLWRGKSISNSVRLLSDYAKNIREKGKSIAKRGYSYGGNDPEHQLYYKNKDKYADRNESLAALVNSCYDKIVPVLAESELGRGDIETEYSAASRSLTRLYGASYFVRILSALGNQKIDRSAYYSYYHTYNAPSRVESLSHLLSICVPGEGDDAESLKAELSGKKIKDSRLVEAALFSPEWINIVGEYLGWEGFVPCCYYFMAHMNERFDDKRKAMIAKYTPLSTEELNSGAFDSEWFKDVYKAVGADRFKIIYDAAKYISDGAKHTRARKYADAALGNLDMDSVMKEIEAKRNKDYVMCLGVIPSKKAADIKDRYLFIRKFEKESKKFGAQRRASEKLVSEMAIKNMATANGYQDDMRFVLRMESKVSEGLLSFFDPKQVEDIEVNLELDKEGKLLVVVNKGGKKLKSIPAKLKKNDYILELQEAKKTLATQGSRSKTMFEEAMEEETPFTIGELRDLSKSPVIGPVVGALVLKAGDEFGFMDELSNLKDKTEVLIAHPWHLYKAGVWRDFQKKIFDMELKQPFKQVFRELYIKTDDEKEQKHLNRFAGNQIQPKRTVALLKTRRWVADMEDGLQKVYYKKNIISSIYALADWFSPADIEEPTLEWVVFYDRKTFKELKAGEVPDILFSETMRDVDLVVSVAHAGEVDPEFSHSTIEMRKAIAEFTLPLFKLTNVTFTDTHALIKGTRGSYSVHLGSGIIHQEGGPMINILPVHSQRRGKIFLPFVDDDPKTAEVISKILLLAEDQKIKDPFILDQINYR